MNDRGKSLRRLPSHESPCGVRADLEKLAVEESELTLGLETVLANGGLDEKSLAQFLQARSSAMQQRISLILGWMDQIDRRVNQMESRLSDLARHATDQDHTLSIMCSVLKEIDDPYGFGQSLDEQIFGDTTHEPTEGREE